MSQIWNTTGQNLEKKILQFTAGDDRILDQKIFLPYDVKASKAHAEMLLNLGILTEVEFAQIEQGLDEILFLWEQGEFQIGEEMEDCHTAIEAYLTEKYGEAGEKIHTARSRNDQSLTMVRLYIIDQLQQIGELMSQLKSGWSAWANRYENIVMPGYTHMQKAMPTTVGAWQGSYIAGIEDLALLCGTTCDLCNQSPLGSGAGYGVPLKIDREFTAGKLGFSKVQNTLYAQLSRSVLEPQAMQVCALVSGLLGRWASDLLLFTTEEFAFFSLPAQFCTGSSIMPQKKNYDVLELMRGKAATVFAAKAEVEQLMLKLFSGYHRDSQLIKEPLVRAFKTVIECLEVATLLASNLEVNQEKLESAMSDEIYATERVYKYVEQGMSFRKAYALVKEEVLEGRCLKNQKLRR